MHVVAQTAEDVERPNHLFPSLVHFQPAKKPDQMHPLGQADLGRDVRTGAVACSRSREAGRNHDQLFRRPALSRQGVAHRLFGGDDGHGPGGKKPVDSQRDAALPAIGGRGAGDQPSVGCETGRCPAIDRRGPAAGMNQIGLQAAEQSLQTQGRQRIAGPASIDAGQRNSRRLQVGSPFPDFAQRADVDVELVARQIAAASSSSCCSAP